MGYILSTLLLGLLTLPVIQQQVEARPISYTDSWTLMQQNNAFENRLHVHYSPNYRHSFGPVIQRFKDNASLGISAQWNHLLTRRNTRESQANVYSKVRIGWENDAQATLGAIELAGDWETRRYFSSYEAGVFLRDDNITYEQTARLGIAPYIANYNAIHTWLMLEMKHQPEAENDHFTLTPLVRFFQGDHLAELGVSEKGDVVFNWIKRF